MKLFELSTSARKASQEVRLSDITTLRAYDVLRRAIVGELAKTDDILKGELEAEEVYCSIPKSFDTMFISDLPQISRQS